MATAPAMATERLLSEDLRGSCCWDTGDTSFLAAAGVALVVAAGTQRHNPPRSRCPAAFSCLRACRAPRIFARSPCFGEAKGRLPHRAPWRRLALLLYVLSGSGHARRALTQEAIVGVGSVVKGQEGARRGQEEAWRSGQK